MDSVLAEYYGPLWEEYHIFGYNTGTVNDAEQKEGISGKLTDYMSYTFQPDKGLNDLHNSGGTDIYQISMDSISVSSKTMLMDYQGQLLINEAVEYMKYREIGGGIELLLDKLNLLEAPEKVSYVYQKKQKVEEELVEIDKGILELMELLDGLKTGKKGIEVTKDGALISADFYIKKICFEPVTKDTVGINQDNIFQAIKDKYVNPKVEFDTITNGISTIGQLDKSIEQQLLDKSAAELKLSEETLRLAAMKAISNPTKEDKKAIKAIEANIESQQTVIEAIDSSITEMKEQKEALITAINAAKDTLSELISETSPLIQSALTTIDTILLNTEKAEPLISEYEEYLYQEKESISEDVFTGLEENLSELKRYTSENKSGYDFIGMKAILENNLSVLAQTEVLLNQGELDFSEEQYEIAKQSFDKAAGHLSTYQINGLTLDYSTLVLDNYKKQDPIGETSNLLKSGITSLVLDPNKISNLELTQDILPSAIAALSQENTDFLSKLSSFFESATIGGDSTDMSALFGSFGEGSNFLSALGGGINGVAVHFLYQEYLKEHFSMYPVEAVEGDSGGLSVDATEKGSGSLSVDTAEKTSGKPSVLAYEQEYLLVGKASDQDNISSVISRILFLRTILDFVSIIGDSAKRDEARLAASALVGFTGLPILISITQAIIMLVWSFAEALLDVCALMMGKEVPIFKKKVVLELPELFMINRSFLQTKAEAIADSKELSLSYQDYLRIFLLIKSKEDIAYRSLDLMQENIKIRYDDSNFNIMNCLFGYQANADFRIEPKFMKLPFVQKVLGGKAKEYLFSVKASYCY